jgi:hypothetical protein
MSRDQLLKRLEEVCDADTLVDLLEISVEDLIERFPERIKDYHGQLCDYCDAYFPETSGEYFNEEAESIEEVEDYYYEDYDQ